MAEDCYEIVGCKLGVVLGRINRQDGKTPNVEPGLFTTAAIIPSTATLVEADLALDTRIDATTKGASTLLSSWIFASATTNSDPGAGKVKLNNTILSSVTRIYINDVDSRLATDRGSVLALLTAGCRVVIQGIGTATHVAVYELTAAPTDNTGWWTINVTHIASNTLFSSNEECGLAFLVLPAPAASIRPLLYSDGSIPGGNTIANTAAKTPFASQYTIPANTLEVGDEIIIEGFGVHSTTGTPTILFEMEFDGIVIYGSGTLTTGSGVSNLGFTFRLVGVVSAVGGSAVVEFHGIGILATSASAHTTSFGVLFGGWSGDSTATIAVIPYVTWGTAHLSNTATLHTLTVKLHKKRS